MPAPQLKSELEASQHTQASLRSSGSTTPSEIQAPPSGRRDAAARGAARILALAASPAFAIMSLLTSVCRGDLVMPNQSRLGGMVTMYLLMSVIHLAPWLELMPSRRRSAVRRSQRDSQSEHSSRQPEWT